jgi:hypothetical protein
MENYKTHNGLMEIGFSGDGYGIINCKYINIPVPTECLYDASHKRIISYLVNCLEEWESELENEYEDGVDDWCVNYYMAVQFGLSILTIDGYALDEKTEEYLKKRFSFDVNTYQIYMRNMFFRSNSPYFNKAYPDNTEWNEDFDVEKEKSKPFLLYCDWLQEKNDDGKTNYERFIK